MKDLIEIHKTNNPALVEAFCYGINDAIELDGLQFKMEVPYTPMEFLEGCNDTFKRTFELEELPHFGSDGEWYISNMAYCTNQIFEILSESTSGTSVNTRKPVINASDRRITLEMLVKLSWGVKWKKN